MESKWISSFLIPFGTKVNKYSASFVYKLMLPKLSLTVSKLEGKGVLKSSVIYSGFKFEWANERSKFRRVSIFNASCNWFFINKRLYDEVQFEWYLKVDELSSKAKFSLSSLTIKTMLVRAKKKTIIEDFQSTMCLIS